MTSQKPGTLSKVPIGLVGAGTMGMIILQKLIAAGHKIFVSDPVPSIQASARENGAHVTTSLYELAQKSSTILLSLPTPDHVKRVVLGNDGLLQSASVNTIVVDTSTVDPGTSQYVGEKALKHIAGYLDAPILGIPASDENWLSPVGGDPKVFEQVKPVLETYVARAVRIGDLGSGNTLKLLNQLMFSTINGVIAEIMAICQQSGISPKIFYETIASSGASTVSGLFKKCGRNIVDHNFEPTFTIDLLCKDSRLGLDMVRTFGTPSLIAQHVHTLNELAQAKGLGQKDTSALFKMYSGFYNEPP